MSNIHPTAIIAVGARLGVNVEVGPFAVIDDHVEVGDNCRLGPHVHLSGWTKIGEGTHVHTGAVIGDEPQDLHFTGAESYTVIGSGCMIREYVTVHRGAKPGSVTEVGDNVMLMAMAHLGHNCRIGAGAILANNTVLAGHVEVGERAFLSGRVMVHQFCRIGSLAIISGGALIYQDVPPFCMFRTGCVRTANVVGMRRAGIDAASRLAVRQAIKLAFYEKMTRPVIIARLEELFGDRIPAVVTFRKFFEATKRGIAPGPASWRPVKGDDTDREPQDE